MNDQLLPHEFTSFWGIASCALCKEHVHHSTRALSLTQSTATPEYDEKTYGHAPIFQQPCTPSHQAHPGRGKTPGRQLPNSTRASTAKRHRHSLRPRSIPSHRYRQAQTKASRIDTEGGSPHPPHPNQSHSSPTYTPQCSRLKPSYSNIRPGAFPRRT